MSTEWEIKKSLAYIQKFKPNSYEVLNENNKKYKLYQAGEALKHTGEQNGKAWKKQM